MQTEDSSGNKEAMSMDLGPYYYKVKRLDGDYAYLVLEDGDNDDGKCVARALLPEISEGSRLLYENLQYEVL